MIHYAIFLFFMNFSDNLQTPNRQKLRSKVLEVVPGFSLVFASYFGRISTRKCILKKIGSVKITPG